MKKKLMDFLHHTVFLIAVVAGVTIIGTVIVTGLLVFAIAVPILWAAYWIVDWFLELFSNRGS